MANRTKNTITKYHLEYYKSLFGQRHRTIMNRFTAFTGWIDNAKQKTFICWVTYGWLRPHLGIGWIVFPCTTEEGREGQGEGMFHFHFIYKCRWIPSFPSQSLYPFAFVNYRIKSIWINEVILLRHFCATTKSQNYRKWVVVFLLQVI